MDKFDRILSSVIDSHLGLRSKLIGYQYSEIIRAVFSVFCCGGDCMEDLNLYLKDVLTERPHTRVPSADTVLRGIEELATENISYTAEKTGNVYDFNTAEELNQGDQGDRSLIFYFERGRDSGVKATSVFSSG